MMKLGFNDRRTISTFDLPYLTCDPPLEFEINNVTSFEWNLSMQNWALEDEASEGLTVQLAAGFLLSVETIDGIRYDLGSEESIRDFVDSTSLEFLVGVLKSWVMLRAIEMNAAQKKMIKRGKPSNSTNQENGQAKQSLPV